MAKVLPYRQKACVCICQIMSKQLPRARAMHSKSVCRNTSLLCRPWPCPFQTTSHLCQIARHRETRKTELAVWKALWTLRATGSIQWIQYKSDLTASILTINNTLQRVNKILKGHGIFSNLGVHSTQVYIHLSCLFTFYVPDKQVWGSHDLINATNISNNQSWDWWDVHLKNCERQRRGYQKIYNQLNLFSCQIRSRWCLTKCVCL